MTFFYSFSQSESTTKKTGMLILGSDNIKTLKERVDVGYKLYNSGVAFDYIIVSGGCSAHKSTICEASEMASLLIEKGVPAEKIFKEEKSKTTVQNYVYSRILRREDGTKLINKGDSLYVVSNHWHAMSVAARFKTYDQVNAVYHIEGNIVPSTKDKVDYVNIFHGNSDSEDFSRTALWPLINASYSLTSSKQIEGKTYNFIGDRLYQGAAGIVEKESQQEINEKISGLPEEWHKGIDAAFYNEPEKKVYLFKGDSYLRFTPNSESIDKEYPKLIKTWIKDLPADWQQGYIDAAFFNPLSHEITLFKGDSFLQLSSKKMTINKNSLRKLTSLENWPFGWGSGNIDAADFNTKERMIYLFRGKEYLRIPYKGKSIIGEVESGYPQSIKVN